MRLVMKKPVLTFGVLAGAIIAIYSLAVLAYVGDFSSVSPETFRTVEILGYLRYVILLLGVFFAIRTFRNSFPESAQ